MQRVADSLPDMHTFPRDFAVSLETQDEREHPLALALKDEQNERH